MLILSTICLTSCQSVKNSTGYSFPILPEEKREETEKEIIVYDKDGNKIFIYDKGKDTVTVNYWYWRKIMQYAIDTNGLTQ